MMNQINNNPNKETLMRKIKRIVMRILMPWRGTTNALWYQQRSNGQKLNDLSFRVNELELATETVKPTKAKRGRPRKQSLKPQTLKGVR